MLNLNPTIDPNRLLKLTAARQEVGRLLQFQELWAATWANRRGVSPHIVNVHIRAMVLMDLCNGVSVELAKRNVQTALKALGK